MMRASTKSRLERLEWLESRLKADEPMILAEIAEELGVSGRTLARDIALLRDRGLPIDAERGRGGGVRVHPNWGVGRIALTYKEAIALLISLAVTEKMESAILTSSLLPIQRKLIASFSTEDQRRIRGLRNRLRVGPPSSPEVLAGFTPPSKRITDDLQQAFLLKRGAILSYRSGDGGTSKRPADVHYLILNYPIWYALCWDHLRGAVRTFRSDRITAIEIEAREFKLRPFADFDFAMAGNRIIVP